MDNQKYSSLPAIGDFVFEDLNADGIQDPNEPGLANVTVKLLDPHGNLVNTTSTDQNGEYIFDDLHPGDYQVMFNNPDEGLYMFSPRQADGDPHSGINSDGPMSDVFSLHEDEFNHTIDAGLFRKAKLGDFVFEDLDQDGIQDAGEPGIAGVEVKLQDPSGQTLETTTTDSSGMYMFGGLTPGDYKVMFNNPDSNQFEFSPRQVGNDPTIDSDGAMSDVVTLISGENNNTIDAGLFKTAPQVAKLGDFVFEDLNADGIQQNNEPGISGAQVVLLDGQGNFEATTPTDSNGMYMFGDLDPGDYKVMFFAPTGFMFSPRQVGNDPAIDSDGSMSDVVTLAAGEVNNTIDAGLFKKAKLGDFVFNDLDQDGIQDSNEPGIAGAQVTLQNPSGTTIDTTTTDANGFYQFTNLTPGDYKVMFTQPSGFDGISPFQAGNNPAVDSDANPNNGLMSDVVSLSSGETNNTIDAGFFNAPPEPAALGDFVFEDLDADGIQDSNEPGIAGAQVKLQDPSGTTLDTTTTDASGFYEFTDLTPGDYKVMFTQPTGFDSISPFQAGNNPAVDSDADPSNGLMSDVVNLAAGEFNDSLDAGFFKFATLGDKVFNDLDRDGIQDAGEPGIAGATVKLQNPGGQTLATTTTNGNGIYEFSDLIPGNYKVMFNQPNGFVPSPFEVGNNPAIDSDANPNNGLMSDVVTLTSGETDNTLDGGFFKDVNAEIDIEKFVKVNGGFGGGDDDDDDNGGYYPYYSGGGDDDDDDNGGYYPTYSGGDDDDDDGGSSGDPNKGFLDADDPPGPDALVGTHVEFKYVVTNPGETALDNIKVTDDKLTPDPLLNSGFNVGDQNKDSLLNPGEEWIFTASETAKEGLQTNLGTAMGTPVDATGNPFGLPDVMDSDPANYTGIRSKGGGDDDDDDNGFSHFIIGDDDDDDRDFSQHLAGDDDDDGGSSGFFYPQNDAYADDQIFSYFFSEGD